MHLVTPTSPFLRPSFAHLEKVVLLLEIAFLMIAALTLEVVALLWKGATLLLSTGG